MFVTSLSTLVSLFYFFMDSKIIFNLKMRINCSVQVSLLFYVFHISNHVFIDIQLWQKLKKNLLQNHENDNCFENKLKMIWITVGWIS